MMPQRSRHWRGVTTAEQKMLRMALAGMLTERHYMERKWWSKLWRAMQHIDDSKRMDTVRAVESAAKPQCKRTSVRQALLAKDSDWRAHIFDPKCVESVTRKVALVKECLSETRALAKCKGEKLLWLDYLPKGIRE